MGARSVSRLDYLKSHAMRIAREKQVVRRMIELYCRNFEGNKELCDECKELMEYAAKRLTRCPFQDKKPTCRLCPIHCYKPQMRDKMKQVMRYAGPRMMWYYPWDALHHMLNELQTLIYQKKRVTR